MSKVAELPSLTELRKQAKSMKLKGYSKLKQAELFELIQGVKAGRSKATKSKREQARELVEGMEKEFNEMISQSEKGNRVESKKYGVLVYGVLASVAKETKDWKSGKDQCVDVEQIKGKFPESMGDFGGDLSEIEKAYCIAFLKAMKPFKGFKFLARRYKSAKATSYTVDLKLVTK